MGYCGLLLVYWSKAGRGAWYAETRYITAVPKSKPLPNREIFSYLQNKWFSKYASTVSYTNQKLL